ncbi:hypothetical protein ACOMHN_066954 [Nucella lapillus]
MQYTRHSNPRTTTTASEGDEKEIEGTAANPAVPVNAVLSKLEAMDNNIIASKEDYKKMDYKIEKILLESFEIRKENIMLKKQIETLTRHCQDMSDEVERLEKKVKEGKEMRNNLEQYTRKDNIKIINLQGDKPKETSDETEKRVVDFLHSQLGLTTITSDHISIAHRVGPYRQSQNRPIIVKFISRKTKVSVMKNKRNLKGQKIYINEDLTKLNAQRLAELKKHIGVLSAWSFEGSLYCKLINLEKIKIEDGGIGAIDRLLIDTPRSQQQGFQQRPGGFGGRESRPTFIGRAVRETRGRVPGRANKVQWLQRGNRTDRLWATGGPAILLHRLWVTGGPAIPLH